MVERKETAGWFPHGSAADVAGF